MICARCNGTEVETFTGTPWGTFRAPCVCVMPPLPRAKVLHVPEALPMGKRGARASR